MAKVVVVGAGISGLSTAYCLLNVFGDQIKELVILAKEVPGSFHAHDYTSPWAGANWHSFASNDDFAQIERDRITYNRLTKLAKDCPESGVKEYKLKLFSQKKKPVSWFIKENFVRDLTEISDEEMKYRNLDPAKYYGHEFTTFTVTPAPYKFWLVGEIKKLGGSLKQVRAIESIEDVPDILGYVPDLVINATGLNAGKFLYTYEPEELQNVHPVKGQIVQIYEDLPFQIVIDKLPAEDDALPYQFLNMFPRGDGGCIIGGIMKKNDWSDSVDKGLSKSIVAVCQNHVPELQNATVYNTYCALRPGRTGGVRVELSKYPLPNGKGELNVVHNYGIGGAGYQASHGLSLEACFVASQVLGSPKSIRQNKCPVKL